MGVAGAVLGEAPATRRLEGGETHSLWQGNQVWGLEAGVGRPWGQRVWVWGTRESASGSEGLLRGQ